MRISPCIILVCLAFCVAATCADAQGQSFIRVRIVPDSMNVGPAGVISLPQQVDPPSRGPVRFQRASGRYPSKSVCTGDECFAKPIVKCKPPACEPPQQLCGPGPSPCIVPRRLPGQWELSVQTFFPNARGKVRWPAVVFGIPTTEVDFNTDLGLPSHPTLLEYGARFQFRPHWAVFYTIMPIHLEGNTITNRTFYFGTRVYPAFTPIKTTWDFTYQRVGVVYQAISNCNATVSVYNSWVFNEQRLSVGSGICGGTCNTVDRTRHMVMSGIEMQKCIRTMCNGGTFSCDNQVGIGYLDGTLAVDLQAGFRFSVPMNLNRWGYVKGGYRLLNLKEDRDDLKLDAFFEGGFAELGLIF